MSTIIRDDDFRKVVAEFGGVVITDTQSQTSMAASLSPDERRALADALNTAAAPYPQGGQWTREIEGELWAAIRDELRHIYPSSTDWHHRKLDLAASASVDAVREKLNAHHPKPEPYDQGGVRGADSLLYRAERERDAAVARAGQAERELAALRERVEDIVPGTEVIHDAWNGIGIGRIKVTQELGVQKLIRDRVYAAIEADAVVDPVEAKARELWEATREGGAPVAAWADAHEDAQAQFRVLARHVLGQETER